MYEGDVFMSHRKWTSLQPALGMTPAATVRVCHLLLITQQYCVLAKNVGIGVRQWRGLVLVLPQRSYVTLGLLLSFSEPLGVSL